MSALRHLYMIHFPAPGPESSAPCRKPWAPGARSYPPTECEARRGPLCTSNPLHKHRQSVVQLCLRPAVLLSLENPSSSFAIWFGVSLPTLVFVAGRKGENDMGDSLYQYDSLLDRLFTAHRTADEAAGCCRQRLSTLGSLVRKIALIEQVLLYTIRSRARARLSLHDDCTDASLHALQAGSDLLVLPVEVGPGVRMEAKLTNARHLFVAVGLGFFAECALAEAPQVIAVLQSYLQVKLKGYEEEATNLQKDIGELERLLSGLHTVAQ